MDETKKVIYQNLCEAITESIKLRKETADIIVRRYNINKFTGASNDIGFKWNGEKFEFIISEYDKRCSMDKRIIQAYVKVVLEESLRKNGFKIKINIVPIVTINLFSRSIIFPPYPKVM